MHKILFFIFSASLIPQPDIQSWNRLQFNFRAKNGVLYVIDLNHRANLEENKASAFLYAARINIQLPLHQNHILGFSPLALFHDLRSRTTEKRYTLSYLHEHPEAGLHFRAGMEWRTYDDPARNAFRFRARMGKEWNLGKDWELNAYHELFLHAYHPLTENKLDHQRTGAIFRKKILKNCALDAGYVFINRKGLRQTSVDYEHLLWLALIVEL
ncbi:MAG: DUF2490 domain-containing protein [Bacteroidia bacterium]|nr:DUF2490 domain-containing protein [Bacteroidia bacterium]